MGNSLTTDTEEDQQHIPSRPPSSTRQSSQQASQSARSKQSSTPQQKPKLFKPDTQRYMSSAQDNTGIKFRFTSIRIAVNQEIKRKELTFDQALDLVKEKLNTPNSEFKLTKDELFEVEKMLRKWLYEVYNKQDVTSERDEDEQDSYAGSNKGTPLKRKRGTPLTGKGVRESQRKLREARIAKAGELMAETTQADQPRSSSPAIDLDSPEKQTRNARNLVERNFIPNKSPLRNQIETITGNRLQRSPSRPTEQTESTQTPNARVNFDDLIDQEIERASSPKKKRRNWSEEEFHALCEGLAMYLTENNPWSAIKKDPRFSTILEHRSVVDLKDKARNERRARERLYGKDSPEIGIFAAVTASGGEGAKKYYVV